MGNTVDKLDENLMKYAPLEQELIDNIYFIHDAFRFMDMISLACEGIIRPTNTDERNRISSLQDLGLILKATGNRLGRESTFSRILIAVGEVEILLGKMENNWAFDIEQYLVKPIQKCINQDADELTLMRDQIMRLRLQIRDAKVSKSDKVDSLENEYKSKQKEMIEKLSQEKRTIAEMKKNLTTVLEKQMEMNQNSIVHLESLVEKLKKNPKKIQIPDKDSDEDLILDIRNMGTVAVGTKSPASVPHPQTTPKTNNPTNNQTNNQPINKPQPQPAAGANQTSDKSDLPVIPQSKNKTFFTNFISKKVTAKKV